MSVEAADEVGLDLFLPGFIWPAAFYIGDNGPDLARVEDCFEARHIAFDVPGRKGAAAEGDIIEQLAVRMLPGMAAGVLRWSRKSAVGQLIFPARLAFQVQPMARGAVDFIERLALGNQSRVPGVGPFKDLATQKKIAADGAGEYQIGNGENNGVFIESAHWGAQSLNTRLPNRNTFHFDQEFRTG